MNPSTLIAVILLATVSLAHLARLAFGWQVTIADSVVPMWVSWIGFVIPLLVAIGLWKASRRA